MIPDLDSRRNHPSLAGLMRWALVGSVLLITTGSALKDVYGQELLVVQTASQETMMASSDETNGRSSLIDAVTVFWNSLLEGDSRAALAQVSTEEKKSLSELYSFPLEEWELKEVRPGQGDFSMVVLEAVFRLPASLQPVPILVEQRWRQVRGHWQLGLVSPQEMNPLEILYGKDENRGLNQERLRVRPPVLVMHFLNSPQRGVVFISNGRSESIGIVRVGLDAENFRLVAGINVLEAGEEGELVFEYTGKSLEKELASKLTLYFSCKDEEFSYEIPVIYNYISPSLKALFSLDPRAIEALEPGMVLAPIIE